MRIVASDLFNSIALGASKRVEFLVSIRSVVDISEPLSGGTAWTDISDITGVSLPSIIHKIEYGVGQFQADGIQLISDGVRAWKLIIGSTHLFVLDTDVLDDTGVVLG